jgi:hypothetical protein
MTRADRLSCAENAQAKEPYPVHGLHTLSRLACASHAQSLRKICAQILNRLDSLGLWVTGPLALRGFRSVLRAPKRTSCFDVGPVLSASRCSARHEERQRHFFWAIGQAANAAARRWPVTQALGTEGKQKTATPKPRRARRLTLPAIQRRPGRARRSRRQRRRTPETGVRPRRTRRCAKHGRRA